MAGAAGFALQQPLLGAAAGALALGAAGASLGLTDRIRKHEEVAEDTDRELAGLRTLHEAEIAARSLVDAATGLPDSRYFELVVESRINAARRHLWPVTLVLLELRVPTPDAGIDPDIAKADALLAFGTMVRQTLREADIACRIEGTTFGLLLEDTAEDGGVWAAERIQIALAKRGRRGPRAVAGLATYPTHGLQAEDLLTRAHSALARARQSEDGHGLGPVEVAPADA
jgi:GGDEF domain-containing protein